MISLVETIPADRLIDLDVNDHRQVLETLIAAALPEASDRCRSLALQGILSKNSAGEIQLGKGFALCHARLDSIRDIELAVGLFGRPTHFLKGDPVHTVFLILIPTNKSRAYMTLMARLSRFLLEPDIEAVFQQGDHARILEELRRFDAG